MEREVAEDEELLEVVAAVVDTENKVESRARVEALERYGWE